VIARLDDSELRDFNYLLGSVDVRYHYNKSKAFREVLRLSAELLREKRVLEGRKRFYDDFHPARATRGSSSIEVKDESELDDYEESAIDG